MWTAAVCIVVIAAVFPELAQHALFNVLNAFLGAIAPLERPILALCIAVFGIWIMFRSMRRGGRGNRH
jgi:hypothetical protein